MPDIIAPLSTHHDVLQRPGHQSVQCGGPGAQELRSAHV